MAHEDSVVSGMVVVAILLAGSGMAEPTMTLMPACDGAGFTGSISDGQVTSYFEACGTSAGVHSRVWTKSGTLTEVWSNADGSKPVYEIGGTAIGFNSTSAQWKEWYAMLSSPEAVLASRSYPLLIKMGLSQKNLAMLGLLQNLTGYEVPDPGLYAESGCSASECSNPQTNCLGCCGSGCAGCTGVCTNACKAHDLCVRNNDPGGCHAKFFAAMASIWSCVSQGEVVCCR
jgi:hypothetical protein